MNKKSRCSWVPDDKPEYIKYHDEEWGRPVHDDNLLFEMLILEGAQAGLSWYTVLKKRAGYKKAFKNLDPKKVSKMSDEELVNILKNGEVVRNRLKIFSVRKNAHVFLSIQKEFGSFDKYIWVFCEKNSSKNKNDPKVESNESIKLSNDLKKRGMSFVGSKIMYAYMQAIGIVNDHQKECYLFKK